jgi:hypothetical protein
VRDNPSTYQRRGVAIKVRNKKLNQYEKERGCVKEKGNDQPYEREKAVED